MLGEDDPFGYHLARDLKLMLDELDAMPAVHYMRWRAFYTWEKTMKDHYAEVARKRARHV